MAHYLVLTNLAEATPPEADGAAAAAPIEVAEEQAEQQAEVQADAGAAAEQSAGTHTAGVFILSHHSMSEFL